MQAEASDGIFNLEVVTSSTRKRYFLDNTGNTDVSEALQDIFNEIGNITAAADGGASYFFASGIYFINRPLTVTHANVKIVGMGHSGIDIHGLNIAGGTCFHFGPECFPDCISFVGGGVGESFPARKKGWDLKCARVELEGLTFIGHNNTDVDTASGYSRMKGDEPNFRTLGWYPMQGRYEDVERDGQRAVVLKKTCPECKPEMLRITRCCFTDLYIGVEVETCDVTNIHNSWFAQLVNGIRYHSQGQATFLSDNCFADLETGISAKHLSMSSLHNNSFAYVSKCFVLDSFDHSSINSNALHNWKMSTGSAAFGAFCHINGPARNVTMIGNSVFQDIDSRHKKLTVDELPTGLKFIQFADCENLVFSSNIIDTLLTESVMNLHNCRNARITNNIISSACTGDVITQTGNCESICLDNDVKIK